MIGERHYKGKFTQKDIDTANKGKRIYDYCIAIGVKKLTQKDLPIIKKMVK